MQVTLPAVLAAQNPWWSDPGARAAAGYPLRRSEFSALRLLVLGQGPQVMLVGPRQAGKTVLLWQLADSFLDERVGDSPAWDPRQVVYFNFEDERLPYRKPLLRDVVEAHAAAFPEVQSRPVVYLLDEVGRSPNWDVSLKHLHTEAAARTAAARRFIITDSAALLLDASSTVAGRFTRHRLPYLSFSDFIRFRRARGGPFEPSALDHVAGPEFDAYLERGGSPAHLFTSDLRVARHEIREATERAVLKDLVTGTRVRRTDKAVALFTGLATDTGTVLNATARGTDVDVSRQVVEKWLHVLVGTGLLIRLDALSRSAREKSRRQPRIYCADPGIAAAYSLSPAPLLDAVSRGRLVETGVLVHLQGAAGRLGAKLSYGTGAAEADFVLEMPQATLVIQVTAGRNANPSDARAASRAAGAVPRGVPLVASRHPLAQVHEIDGGRVREVPAWSLCARLTDALTSADLVAWARP